MVGGGIFNLNIPTTLIGIQTIDAEEGQAAAVSGDRVYASTTQVITLRDGLDATVNVAPATITAGNPKPATITINGAQNADVINLGAGYDAVTVGSIAETIHGGTGHNTISVTAATIGAAIDGGTGTSELLVSGGGAMFIGSNITRVGSVLLAPSTTAYDFHVGGIGGLLVQDNSTGLDTLSAGASNQTLTGGAPGALTMVGDKATNFQNSAASFFNDVIKNLDLTDRITITGLAYMPGATSAAYTVNQDNTSGVLDVSVNGSVKAAINLVGSYTNSFFAGGDATNTLISYNPGV